MHRLKFQASSSSSFCLIRKRDASSRGSGSQAVLFHFNQNFHYTSDHLYQGFSLKWEYVIWLVPDAPDSHKSRHRQTGRTSLREQPISLLMTGLDGTPAINQVQNSLSVAMVPDKTTQDYATMINENFLLSNAFIMWQTLHYQLKKIMK